MTYSVACLPATTAVYRAPGIPDSRSSDQYFSATLQNLSNLEKGETCPNELVNLAAPLHSRGAYSDNPQRPLSSILKIVLNQKQ